MSVLKAPPRNISEWTKRPPLRNSISAAIAYQPHFSRSLTQRAIAKFGNTLLGVNMGLANETDLAGIELRYPDGKAWSGEGEFHYVRNSRVIGN